MRMLTSTNSRLTFSASSIRLNAAIAVVRAFWVFVGTNAAKLIPSLLSFLDCLNCAV
ncbi:hypothetical protein PR002_g8221 [Phytophthora rubi]|uniref:Uncharacterized protein n=1 Tax=Phytophthora rubi TaxID=129364 RepID=A0A6A3MY01_9STRA|nr:hypothetical protein PR002_g8221 [Phytophthora rubi]